MTSVHNLQFSQSMTATSKNSTTDVQITEEKMFIRRTSIHKHLMTVMALIHISISSQTLQQIFFRFYLIKLSGSTDVMTCSLISPLIYILYQMMNCIFVMLFLKFVITDQKYYAESIVKEHSKYAVFVKVCMVIPQSMIFLKYGGQYYCEGKNSSIISKEDFIFQHLVLELVFVKFYLNWFICEIINLQDEDNVTYGSEPNSLKKSDSSSLKKTAPRSAKKIAPGSLKKVCEVNN